MPRPFPSLPSSSRGTIRRIDYRSTLLATNYWSDPSVRDLYVYTPPSYEDQGELPCLLVLHAFAGSAEGLLARGLSDISIASRFDQMIADGCPPFIGVIPDCMTTLGGCQYLDSPAIGAYGSFVIHEVIPAVEAAFSVNSRWAAIGRSSGGYGALRLAMEHPGKLNGVGCLAGDMGFDLCYLGDLSKAVSGMNAAGGPENFLSYFWAQNRPNGSLFAALNIVAMSCAYSPNLSKPYIPADFPINFATGEVNFEVLHQWRQHDPITLIENSDIQQSLSQLDHLFIDAGDRDEYNLHLGARRFVERLRTHEIPHHYEEFPGGHRGTSYRYDTAIPALIRALC
jgi:enterochelin esterase-like enzyme